MKADSYLPIADSNKNPYICRAIDGIMRITRPLQEKLEGIFSALDFKVRYEKGNFKSGYCILEETNVIVINKFLPLESKVNTLLEILKEIDLDESRLDAKQLKLIQKLKQTTLQF